MKISSRLFWVVFAIMLIMSPVSLNAQKYNKYSDSYNFRKGIEALDERDSRKAEESFSKEIEEHPENAYAYLFLAHIQFIKNEYLTPDDVIGKARYIDANGDISIGTVLNIREITFGGLELKNVRASVVESNNAPLLLGQSVLNRLGKIEIDYDRSVLKITTKERKE